MQKGRVMLRVAGGIPYELTRGRVKRLNLHVRRDGTVALSIPLRTTLEAADAFAAARTQLATFAAGKDYAAWLVKSAAALAETMGESGTLYARTADLPLLQGKLPAGVALAADDTITLGGLRAANPTTGLAADDTLEARLDAQHDWFLQNAGLEITI